MLQQVNCLQGFWLTFLYPNNVNFMLSGQLVKCFFSWVSVLPYLIDILLLSYYYIQNICLSKLPFPFSNAF